MGVSISWERGVLGRPLDAAPVRDAVALARVSLLIKV
jgi:hypothetical protein